MLTLSVTANGPGESSFIYQWKRKGSTPFPSTAKGKNSKNLKISFVTSSDSGSYYCVVMNQWGNMVNSNEATVNVLCKLILYSVAYLCVDQGFKLSQKSDVVLMVHLHSTFSHCTLEPR